MLDGYPQPYTIGTRLAAGVWTGNLAIHWRKVGEITVEGRPLRDEPYRTRTPAPTDYRLSKKFGEVLAVARVLGFLERSGDLQPSERPDVIVTTRVDGRVGVEVAEITDTGPHSGVLDELRIEVNRRLAARGISPRAGYWFWFDPETAERNGVGAGYEASDSGRFLPRGRDRERVLDEIVKLADSETPGWIDPVDASGYPTLARYGVRYAKQTLSADEAARHGFVRIGEGSVAYDPSTLVPTAEAILAQKRETARTYDWDGPLWLVLHITDRRGEFFETAQAVAEARPEIEPFQQVHILYHELLMTTNRAYAPGWMQQVILSTRLRGHRGRRYRQLE